MNQHEERSPARRREEIRAAGLSEPLSHYTDAVRCGEFLYVSGCAPFDANGELVAPGDVVAQTRQVLTNMGQVLDAAGMGFEHVAKVTVFLADAAHRTLINPVRQEFFGDTLPASTLIEASGFVVDDMLVEIEAVAWRPEG